MIIKIKNGKRRKEKMDQMMVRKLDQMELTKMELKLAQNQWKLMVR